MTTPRILLIVSGGIAAYKSLELVRLLKRDGMRVRAVLTKGGAEFVTPLSLGALTEDHVYSDMFDLKDEREIGHIQLSRQADLVVVCPASADIIAKMAAGIADDLATTILLATDKPVLAIPAMNVRMWEHAATRRNIRQLAADGVTIMEPDEGDMACGEWGKGRLPDPEAIAGEIRRMLSGGAAGDVITMPPARLLSDASGPLSGKHVLVTAGPTHEPIDPVRYIANRSSGKQGYAIAAAAAQAGARVTLISGPVELPTPRGVTRIDVQTAREMLAAVEDALPADAAVLVAAVADWRVERQAGQKLKKDGSGAPAPLPLTENPDILATLAISAQRPRLLVGFAAETEHVIDHAKAKLARKGCDLIVANDVSGDVMGGSHNRVHLVSAGSVESWDETSKENVAARLVDYIANRLAN
ncbi:MAG: bifunctional phosphopantothenoylcysteine decarboxylase/phosphopantothenate--cysteine ligase CoaBC [Sphingobium sp.]|jgi:phosphopantothenoylcysteine decarboxylase/phosphopantothenate--cysteine ligase|nr:bifunctional phosphopantothenoylcysteine decarboxylase/phosphopantothenate--cysteine ligase CoaBC [Sphingobium sp.]MCI1270578.1 bifunctional phosphopantothenoylcysteine decarboxylase/phosphopantothenate--cysteine ligase CoaBC [Sphingobium sp.]MCI1757232.1 bifunctional phosphopantothenoylcysteine decarboxylase/phosphopantothenate--cysteine ligase CoaBC [Sphingobium sp.]MCI2052748.1 bifunctional phosphopantothenoylcysteine decarboxylase/phosphopantothenate--cysteine ligase CoaBC [Sphingobium sp